MSQRSAINEVYYDGRLQRALNIPPPEPLAGTTYEDGGDTSDMNLSDGEQRTMAKSLRRDTHAFSADEITKTGVDTADIENSEKSDSAQEGEESRYVTKPSRLVADGAARRALNRFESLTNQKVQYVMSDSDEEEYSLAGDATFPIAHARKRRRIESEPRLGQTQRASRRDYWASKGQAE